VFALHKPEFNLPLGSGLKVDCVVDFHFLIYKV